MPTNVEWPDRRRDVVAALEVLASDLPAVSEDGHDPRWPGLIEAVHWLIDDTFWDVQDPVASVGALLRNEQEAVTVERVVAAIMVVAERQGATAADASWFADPGWAEVRSAASGALRSLAA